MDHIKETAEYIKEIITERKVTYNDTILLMGDFNVDAHVFRTRREKIEKNGEIKFAFINEYEILINTLNELFKANDLWMVNI